MLLFFVHLRSQQKRTENHLQLSNLQCCHFDIVILRVAIISNVQHRDCQVFFNFDLPSMLLRKRTNKFIGNYRNSGNDLCKFLCTT